jgi:hypothetical protein
MSGLPIQVYSMAIKAETTTAGSSGTFRMTARVAPAAANRNIGQRVHVVKVHNMEIQAEKTREEAGNLVYLGTNLF